MITAMSSCRLSRAKSHLCRQVGTERRPYMETRLDSDCRRGMYLFTLAPTKTN